MWRWSRGHLGVAAQAAAALKQLARLVAARFKRAHKRGKAFLHVGRLVQHQPGQARTWCAKPRPAWGKGARSRRPTATLDDGSCHGRGARRSSSPFLHGSRGVRKRATVVWSRARGHKRKRCRLRRTMPHRQAHAQKTSARGQRDAPRRCARSAATSWTPRRVRRNAGSATSLSAPTRACVGTCTRARCRPPPPASPIAAFPAGT